MYRPAAARSLTTALLSILIAATCLPAQPLLSLADTFHGVPFIRAGHLALAADGELLYASEWRSGLTVLHRSGGGFEVVAS